MGTHTFREQFLEELRGYGLPQGPDDKTLQSERSAQARLAVSNAPVTEADIAPLPEPAQRLMRFMGVIGRPRDWSFRAGMTGRFRTAPDAGWSSMEAWQYDTRLDLARIFDLKIRMHGILPVVGRDTYVHGEGRMLVKPFDLFTAVDGEGEAYNIGELVTYLNDAVLIAPSMLLVPNVKWSAVDTNVFDVALSDRDTTVTARVTVNSEGAPLDFETTDRFVAMPDSPAGDIPVRARWSTPVEGYKAVGDRMLPVGGKAVWHLPEGEFCYCELTFLPGELAFNVPPGA